MTDQRFSRDLRVIELVFALEKVAHAGNSLGVARIALASALWRAIQGRRTPLASLREHAVAAITLRDGGRRLCIELDFVPELELDGGLDEGFGSPTSKGVGGTGFVDSTVAWRGSVTDVVTDLSALLTLEQLEELAHEAMRRWEKAVMFATPTSEKP